MWSSALKSNPFKNMHRSKVLRFHKQYLRMDNDSVRKMTMMIKSSYQPCPRDVKVGVNPVVICFMIQASRQIRSNKDNLWEGLQTQLRFMLHYQFLCLFIHSTLTRFAHNPLCLYLLIGSLFSFFCKKTI